MRKRIPIDIISGFLGSGKTTVLNALLETAYKGENIAVIENEFGEVDIDSKLLPGDIEITKITGGCVCCTLKVSLIEGIREIADRFEPDRIVIETTGVAKLSDVEDATNNELLRNIVYTQNKITVVNPTVHLKFEELMGAFYNDQIDSANIIYVSRKEITEKRVFADVCQSIADRGGESVVFDDIGDLTEYVAGGANSCGGAANGCKSEANECEDVADGCNGDANGYKHGENSHIHNKSGVINDEKEHFHSEKTANDEFASIVVDVPALPNKQALNSLIDRIVRENLPNVVLRIKGSVTIAEQSKLVQWVQGDLELFDSNNSDGRLVVVVGRI